MLSEGNLVDLEKKAAKLIDRGRRRRTGALLRIPKRPPRVSIRGGLGALPLREHIQARWANWAVRFVRAMATPERDPPPRVVVILCGTHHECNPLSVFTSRPEVPWFGETTLPRGHQAGSHGAGVPAPGGETPLVTRAWCWNVILSSEGGRPGVWHKRATWA
jgi:hypothetical protein